MTKEQPWHKPSAHLDAADSELLNDLLQRERELVVQVRTLDGYLTKEGVAEVKEDSQRWADAAHEYGQAQKKLDPDHDFSSPIPMPGSSDPERKTAQRLHKPTETVSQEDADRLNHLRQRMLELGARPLDMAGYRIDGGPLHYWTQQGRRDVIDNNAKFIDAEDAYKRAVKELDPEGTSLEKPAAPTLKKEKASWLDGLATAYAKTPTFLR